MNQLNIKKYPVLKHELIDKPLLKLKKNIISNLENETRNPTLFFNLVNSQVSTSFRTYESVLKLLAKPPRFLLQAQIMNRTSIEALYNVIALIENPEKNSKKYWFAGYRQFWESYIREIKTYENDPNWENFLQNKKKYLEKFADDFDLTQDEKDDPSNKIDYWPTPPQLLKSNMIRENSKNFLNEIDKRFYGPLSSLAHLQFAGIALDFYSAQSPQQNNINKQESNSAYFSILFLLMIVSAVECFCKYGLVDEIRNIWNILNNYSKEAKEFFNLRYNELLDSVKK